MDATGGEVTLWQQMLERPNFWVEGSVPLRTAEKLAHAWKTINRFLVLTRAGGKPFRGQGDNCPHIPKKLLELPPAFLTLVYQQHSEFTMKKNKKNKNHDYQNKINNKQNVRRDVLIGKNKWNPLSLWYCTYSSLINISLIWRKKHLWLY